MAWQVRHQGSPKAVQGLTLEQVADGLRDGRWEPTDEVQGTGEPGWSAIENHPQLSEIAMDLEPVVHRRHEEATSLDLNALIDVCLVLLIFFILTTTYVTAVQKVVPLPTIPEEKDKKGPRPVSSAQIKRMIRVQAYLDPAGKTVVRVENQNVDVAAADGKTIDVEKLREALLPYARGEEKKTEVILDSKDVSWGTVIAIQDGAKAAGVKTIHHLLAKKK